MELFSLLLLPPLLFPWPSLWDRRPRRGIRRSTATGRAAESVVDEPRGSAFPLSPSYSLYRPRRSGRRVEDAAPVDDRARRADSPGPSGQVPTPFFPLSPFPPGLAVPGHEVEAPRAGRSESSGISERVPSFSSAFPAAVSAAQRADLKAVSFSSTRLRDPSPTRDCAWRHLAEAGRPRRWASPS